MDRAEQKKVLLVDDVVEIRYLLRMLLANVRRCQVVGEAENGREAVELAQRVKPDVVILDVGMPILDGLRALPLILEAAPHSKVIVYSSEDPAAGPEALGLGAFRFIQKGTDPTLVVDAVRAALDPTKSTAAPAG